MKKIDEIDQHKIKPSDIFTKGIIRTLFFSVIVWLIYPFSFSKHISEERIAEILWIIPAVILIFIIHEIIHILFFLWLGKGAKIEIKREKKYGAVIMHQVNEAVYYNRLQIIIILLSPMVILTSLLLGAMFFIDIPFLLYVNIVLNFFGSSTDIYLVKYLMRFPSSIMMNFSKDEIKMNIYEKE